ncbi:hypothetical protein S7711_00027 [Stachybotrys chartarum IBT 7711]|uniref:Calcofluor white hypersensitive protein n=1 Tax=Stachybotrys chartarum (strain CBS 109288 / IBT 7711) TaxID=1280523 RepID=A0A084B378_STACB|nr:hypothetical protein S7711_00027 [Stachybotrys chartarum IBT 7711]KFA45951.1 hypothetical protein S40293_07314 [Stachybotrys chartarum IBT 40293]KFA73835.1 hypothetical protein S40288_07852 [Stachybotrys chartarum IBT 40288]
MSRSRLPLVLGLGAASGVGYYLYNAGGSPKAAEKKFESDIHKASATAKAHLPGSTPGAEQKLKGAGADAGEKIDKTYAEIDRQTSRAKSNVEAYTKDAKAEAIKAVDKFDAKVEEGAAKAKGGISSWFGGSK